MRLGEKVRYWEERKKFYNGFGLSTLDVKLSKDMDKKVYKEVWQRGKDIEKQTILGKINESTFNPRFKSIMTEGLPKYLRKYNEGRELTVITRIRCGNVERVNKYWLEEKNWICILCKKDWCTFDHLLEICEVTKKKGKNVFR